jgi:LPXTG-motif cell wall-anchored protein
MAVDPGQIIRIAGDLAIRGVDAGARNAYQKKVNELSNEQQQKLAADLLKAKTDSERIALMNAAVGQAKSQSALNKIALSRNIGFVILGVGVLALGVALIYTRRKR